MDQNEAPKREIRRLLLSGGKWTSGELNRKARTVDSRKCVSRLRREGMPIADEWDTERGHRFKRYFYKEANDKNSNNLK